MNDVPEISVIIPAYNAEKYIREAVGSVKAQDYDGPVEILVIDDGSTDQTSAVAEELGCLVLKKENAGAASARNAGIRQAKGNRIFFLDADDVLNGHAFAALCQPMSEDPAIQIVCGKAVEFVSPELTEEQATALKARNGSYSGTVPGCTMIRKEVFESAGLFDESLKSGETVDWMMRVREKKIPVLQIEETTVRRRLHLTNTGRVKRAEEMKNYAALLRKRMKKS